MTNRSFVILAVSLAAGLGVTFVPESLENFPGFLKSILESGIATGSLFALVLNLVLPNPTPTQPPKAETSMVENNPNVIH